MKVHLIRSEEIQTTRFRTISEIIEKYIGPIEFIFNKEDIAEDPEESGEEGQADILNKEGTVLERLPWSMLFTYCEDFRKKNRKIKPDELVVFFTDHGNFNDQGDEGNWFSSWDPSGKLNFFIQTSGWEDFIESEAVYPVIYELVTIPLYLSVCKDLEEVKSMAHYDSPRGCPFDFCEDKIQVKLRLRTGDVCPDCREKMIEKNIDPGTARQIFSILDDIRSQMLFRKQFGITEQLTRMEISYSNLKFTDIGNISVHLPAREMTFYIFFLRHPEGVDFRDMNDYSDDIRLLYRKYCSDANLPKFNNALNGIINSQDVKSWLLNKINSRIEATIGTEIGHHYTINRKPQVKKDGSKSVEYDHYIPLDRNLVTIDGKLFEPAKNMSK